MYRRLVSLLLLPCALTPSAATAHGHAGGRPAGHDSRPHLHLKREAHHHGHSHGGGVHHHHHDGLDPDPAVPPPEATRAAGHDQDAFFVPNLAAPVGKGGKAGVGEAA